MRGMYSNSSTSGSHSVSFTKTSNPNWSASRSTPESSPILTPTLVIRESGRRCASACTYSRIEVAMPNSCIRLAHCRTAGERFDCRRVPKSGSPRRLRNVDKYPRCRPFLREPLPLPYVYQFVGAARLRFLGFNAEQVAHHVETVGPRLGHRFRFVDRARS